MAFRVLTTLIGLLMFCTPCGTAFAIQCDLVVDRTDDIAAAATCNSATPNDCSLRGALNVATSGDIICLDQYSTYELELGQLDITTNVTLYGLGTFYSAITLKAGSSSRLVYVQNGVTATLYHLDLHGGVATGESGGCILNEGSLTVRDVSISQCTVNGAYSGGGIRSVLDSTLVVDNSVISYNEAYSGGGLSTSGNLTVTDSRIMYNDAVGSTGGGVSASGIGKEARFTNSRIINNTSELGGGGLNVNYPDLYLAGCDVSYNHSNSKGGGVELANSALYAVNTTISNNTTTGDGGGIELTFTSQADLSFCTITDNTADSDDDGVGDGGGVYAPMDDFIDDLTIKGSVIAGNTDATTSGAVVPDVYVDGIYVAHAGSLGNNFIGSNAGATAVFPEGSPNADGDRVGSAAGPLDPMLQPLNDNGGDTYTHASQPGSPLVNRGPVPCTDIADAPVATDQRGEPRPTGFRADIGAFESDFIGAVIPPIIMNLQ